MRVKVLSILVLITTLLAVPYLQVKPVLGHGLHSDEVMIASLEGRALTGRVEIYPPTLDTKNLPDEAFIRIRVFDANNPNSNVQNVSYNIRVTQGGKLLLLDNFYSPDGDLWLRIKPDPKMRQTMINAPQEPTGLPKWIGTFDHPVDVRGPIITDGGLYEFKIEIWSIDTPKRLLEPTLNFNAYVTVATIQEYEAPIGKLELRSFYDKILTLDYKEDNNAITFTMPMNWDKKYLTTVPFIHQEVVFDDPSKIVDKYTGLLNGFRLPESNIVVDRSAEQPVVHFMIFNNTLQKIADHFVEMGVQPKIAEFTLIPGEVDVGTPLDVDAGQLSKYSAKGAYHISISVPDAIEPMKPTAFSISIMDANTGAFRDVLYQFVVIKDGQELARRNGATLGGSSVEYFTFTDQHAGPVTIRLEKIGNSEEESAEFSVTVVPEFPWAVFALIGALGSAVALARSRFAVFVR
ncbi:MAG: hypothetical protein QW572_01950 [Candidatus Nitrosocaldus sp.]